MTHRYLPLTAFLLLCATFFLGAPAQAAQLFKVNSISASPTTVQPGQTVNFSASVTSRKNVSNYTIIFQLSKDNTWITSTGTFTGLTFNAHQAVSETSSWVVPAGTAAGTYTILAGVFDANWNWQTGATATFTVSNAVAVNGACGSSNGATLSAGPTSNLCTAGTASAVTGMGPWNWSCTGSNNGTTASCAAALYVAPKACVDASGASHVSGTAYTLQVSKTSGSTTAAVAQCPYGGTQPTTTTVTQNYTCANGVQTAQGSPVTTVADNGNPSCNAPAACGSTPSGSTVTQTISSTTGSIAATTAQCPNGGTQPTTTTVTQLQLCTNGTLTNQGSQVSTTTNTGNPSCNAAPLAFSVNTVTATPATVQPGQTVTFATSVTANQTVSNYTVGLQVGQGSTYIQSGSKLFTGLSFKAGTPVTETSSWTIPAGTAAGTYTILAGVFDSNWNWQTGKSITFTVDTVPAAACGSTPSGSTVTQTVSTTAGSIAATTAQCPFGGTQPTTTTVTQLQLCTNGTLANQGAPITTTANTGSPSCNAAAACGSTPSGSTVTQTISTTTGSIAATTAQCPNGGTQPTKTTVTQLQLCTNGTLANQGAPITTTVNNGNPSCNTAPINGACGSSNGAFSNTVPTNNLCNAGTASAVSGSGPWTWSCTGSNSGTTAICETSTASGGATTFTPLHTYYLSPKGSDSNSGTSPSSPWATPNHAVNCGDVIIAAAGNYTGAYSPFGTNSWGVVSNCPSTSGGIDGKGGVYFATVLCAGPDITSCTITNTGQEGVRVDQSNWAIEGFYVSENGNSECFMATSETGGAVRHHIAFINDIASDCQYGGFGSVGWAAAPSGVDQTAAVGVIAENAAQGAGVCGSGISFIPTDGTDTSSDTHVFVAGAFSYDNINGFCGNRSNGSGSYTTASTSSAPGATSITVSSITNWVVGLPIGDLGSSSYNNAIASIPPGTYITSISGSGPYTIGLSKSIVSPGVVSGDAIAAMTTTDGEGVIFDTWENYHYSGVVEQSAMWGNGSAGFEFFCNGATNTCPSSLNVHIFNNSMYGNSQDVKHQNSGTEILPSGTIANLFIYNNLAQSSTIRPPGSVYNNAAGTGWPTNAGSFGVSGFTITDNFLASAPGALCPEWATCDSGNNVAQYNGVDYNSGNFFGVSPGFNNPSALPSNIPNCSGLANTTACMTAAGVVNELTPSGSAAGKGYQPPGPCTADPYFPTWLKGVVYLSWNGSTITENPGLITKPCGM